MGFCIRVSRGLAGRFTAIALVLLLSACLMGAVAPEVAQAADSSPSISVSNAFSGKLTIKKGAAYKLGAKAPNGKLSYKSSNPSVAKVTRKGAVKAIRAGKTVITVKAKNGKATSSKKVSI